MKRLLLFFVMLAGSLGVVGQTTLPASSKLIGNQVYRDPAGGLYIYMGYNFNPNAYFPLRSSTNTDSLLALKIDLVEKAVPNGVATLDGSGKVPLSQINDALIGAVNYRGIYKASIDSPALGAASAGNKGWYYIVSTAGTQGGITYAVNDWAISNGVVWSKLDNNNTVSSVFGRVGAVTAQAGDYAAFYESPLTFTTGLTRSTNTIAINQSFAPTWAAQHTFDIAIKSDGADLRDLGSLAPIGPIITANYDVPANPKTRYNHYGQSTTLGGAEFLHSNGSGVGTITSAYANPSGNWLFYYKVNLPNETANRVPVIDASNNITSSSVSSTTLGYLDATSSIQTQLNGKQASFSGTGFLKFSGTTPSYDNSTYLTTSSAASTYLPLSGGTLSGGLAGTTLSMAGTINSTTNYRIKNWETLQPSSATPDILQFGGMGASQWGTIDIYISAAHQARIGYGNTWFYGNVIADGNVTSNSDIRLKKNLKRIGSVSDALMKIKVYNFDWRKNGKHDKGFIAQNIEKYFPEFVVTDKKGKKLKSVAYGKMTVPLLKGWQEHEVKINNLFLINYALMGVIGILITYILIKRK